MSNKILNTRLQVRIDELTNWRNSTIKLLPGELAIATVAATVGTGLEEPVCMIKIGDYKRTASGAIERDVDGKGILQTFEELPYALHAKSSDVLAACKTQSGLENFVKSVLASEGVASDEVVSGLANRINALEAKVDVAKVTTAIKDAIDALNIPTTYVKVEDYNSDKSALEGRVNTVETTYAKNSDIVSLKTELNGNIDAAEGRVNEKITTLTNNAATKQELSALENAAATKTALAEVSAAVDTKADKAAFEEVEQTVKDFFSEDAVIEGAINTLKEIVNFVSNDTTGASTLAARVGAVETKVDTEGKVSSAISTAVAGETTLREAADAAEKKAREDADTALSNRIKVYEDEKDSYAAKSELERVEGIANAAYILPEDGIEEDLSADVKTSLGKADSALQEITSTKGGLKVSNKNNIEIDDTVTFIFDCGDAFGNPLN